MYDFELVGAATKMLRDMFDTQQGEAVVITLDTESSDAVAEATAQAAYSLGAKPIIVKTAAARGVGKAADADLPMKELIGILSVADIWIEYNMQWIFYSTVFDEAKRLNKNIRYLNLCGASPELVIRNIGRVDIPLLREFILKVDEITAKTKHFRVTTPAGTDLEFDNVPGRSLYTADGYIRKGEIKMMLGQISWAPDFKSINGTLVFDGALTPPLGKLTESIKCTVVEGKVVKIEGGQQAREFEDWLKSFNDDMMFRLAHISYGFGPWAKLSGDIVEDERVWGSTEWGLGNVGPMLTSDIPGGIPGASHTDGICMNSTVYLDGKLLLKEGVVVGPTEEIVSLARKLGK